MKPFGIASDLHCFGWSQFSSILPNGLNSRFQHILDELRATGLDILAAGGDTLYIAGDLFHVRGSVSPQISNPLIDLLQELNDLGLRTRILTGNHDLESRNSEALSSACETLRTVSGVKIVSKPTVFWEEQVVMVPWYDQLDDIRKNIDSMKNLILSGVGGASADDPADFTLIIHAPVNGILMGIPDHGFWAKELEVLGFKYVFAGHYHNHREFPGGVYSVGATTHQTWNDVGTVAGHLIVDDAGVRHIDSCAPKFIDYDLSWDEDEASEACEGNFVRIKMGEATDEDIAFIREHVEGHGAIGALVQAIPVPKGTITTRTAPTVSAPTTRQSIGDWINTSLASADPLLLAEVHKLASAVLDEVEAVTV